MACHLRGLGLLTEPERLLRRMHDLEYVPLERADECCGFGGSFSVRYPEISGAMVRDKTTFIEKTGVDVVVATDAGCLMNIGGRLRRQGGRAGQCTSRKCWRGRRERRPHMDEYGDDMDEEREADDASEDPDPPRPVRGFLWLFAPAAAGVAFGAIWSTTTPPSAASILWRRCWSAAAWVWRWGPSLGVFSLQGGPAFMTDHARHEHHDFLNAAGRALADPPLQAALTRLTDTLLAGNRRGYAALADSGALRDHAKRIKEHTLAHLDQYLEQLEASVRGSAAMSIGRRQQRTQGASSLRSPRKRSVSTSSNRSQ